MKRPRTPSEGHRSLLLAGLLLAASLAAAPAAAHPAPATAADPGHGEADDGFWNVVNGFATKNGYRLVFSWDADAPVAGYALWGFSPDALEHVARPPTSSPATAGMAMVDIPGDVNRTIHYKIVDGFTGRSSDVHSFQSANAWRTDGSDKVHELDLFVQLDTSELPDILPVDQGLRNIADGMDIVAERIWDATDGHVRVDEVLVTDTTRNYPANVPLGASCGADPQVNGWDVQHTPADILIQTSAPFDSHTTSKAIADQCLGIYIGRLGQLVIPWGFLGNNVLDGTVHFGQVVAHEVGHYAMGLPDLYDAGGGVPTNADCWEDQWDISMMHNEFGWSGSRWEGSELDRGPDVTPCDYAGQPASWPILADLYPGVPTIQQLEDDPDESPVPDQSDSDPDVMRGNPDGGVLDVYVLDHEPGSSRMTHVIDSSGPDTQEAGVLALLRQVLEESDEASGAEGVAGLLP